MTYNWGDDSVLGAAHHFTQLIGLINGRIRAFSATQDNDLVAAPRLMWLKGKQSENVLKLTNSPLQRRVWC